MTSNIPSEESDQPKKEEPTQSKLSETLDSLKKNEKMETLYTYATANTFDTVAYVLLVLGILWMLFNSFYGGILVGVVVGFYFSKELVDLVLNFNQTIEQLGMVRSLILGGTALAFFISAPGIFFGAVATAALKYLITSEKREQ